MPKNRIHKRKDGRYTYSVSDVAGKRHSLTSRGQETREAFAKRCDDLDKMMSAEVRAETLDDLFEMFATQYLTVYNSKADCEITSYLYRDHVQALLGHRKLSEISRSDVNHLLTTAVKKGLSPSTVKKIRGCISRPYNWAINQLGMAITSPTQGLIFRYDTKSTRQNQIRIITDDEARRFFDVADDTKYANYYRLLFATGLRPSEALGLKITDIKTDHIEIRRGVTVRGVTDLKTSRARRDIPMTDEIRLILRDQTNRVQLTTRERWLFPTSVGQPDMGAVLSAFHKARRRTGTWTTGKRGQKIDLVTPPVDFTLYDFRHTFATKMAEAGVSEQALTAIMGHADISTTLKYYVGLTDRMMDGARQAMSQMVQKMVQNNDNEQAFGKAKTL